MITILENLPFCLGPRDIPNNPIGLPDVLDISLTLNKRYAMLEQKYSESTTHLLGLGYSHGIPLGTPSSDTSLGIPYVEEFLEYIDGISSEKGTVLEIGAGTGYLSYRLIQNGWTVTSLEPGNGYEDDWNRFGLSVVNDFYPTKHISEKFDLIVMYTVLEHISDIEEFLDHLKDQMTSQGKIIIAVPDCTEELIELDPSMIIHEHARYFTKKSLMNLLRANGFDCDVERSNFGRSLFAQAKMNSGGSAVVDSSEMSFVTNYLSSIKNEIEGIREKINNIASVSKIAIYCPSRMLNILPVECEYQFIDDDSSIHGRYYPPFRNPVTGISALDTKSPTTIIIGSRTFFEQIRKQLPLNNWDIVGITELLKKRP
jgi:2-polyprenyl-3-methyl-5-hydroxy-6-metoxy-1,4-benzoquinol methylase